MIMIMMTKPFIWLERGLVLIFSSHSMCHVKLKLRQYISCVTAFTFGILLRAELIADYLILETNSISVVHFQHCLQFIDNKS